MSSLPEPPIRLGETTLDTRPPLERHPYGEHDVIFPPDPDPSLDSADIPLPTRLHLYRALEELRQLEKRAYDLFMQGLVKGTSHLSLGMEAVAAGFAAAMRPDDYTFATYRGHAHTLARGVEFTPVLAELMGRANGLLGGKGGSMHLTSVEHGMMGSYAIIGAHLVIANGAAWSAQFRESGQVTVCFFGDGTTNIGAFHEALNFAAVFALPIVFVCENNLYMEYTAIGDVTAVESPAAGRAAAYGLSAETVDGNDVDAVYTRAKEAIAWARAGYGPRLIEAITYRSGGHSRADPGKYRPEVEVKAWQDYDPLTVYRDRLERIGVEAAELDAIRADVARAVDEATEAARAAPEPDPSAAFTDVWADGSATWRN
jgi:acetoin:2,6-dichlorophenolindophenol oxidoreductase subunit alpha